MGEPEVRARCVGAVAVDKDRLTVPERAIAEVTSLEQQDRPAGCHRLFGDGRRNYYR
jgi:hypothetical protein